MAERSKLEVLIQPDRMVEVRFPFDAAHGRKLREAKAILDRMKSPPRGKTTAGALRTYRELGELRLMARWTRLVAARGEERRRLLEDAFSVLRVPRKAMDTAERKLVLDALTRRLDSPRTAALRFAAASWGITLRQAQTLEAKSEAQAT